MKKVERDFFKFKYNRIKPSPGRILISEPFLNDMYFKRSVVLITEHNDKGSMGFVLNKPVNISVNEVVKDFVKVEANVSIGGPVSTNTVHYLHTYGEVIPNSIHIFDNIYWGGDFNLIRDIVNVEGLDNGKLRFFLGYSGWTEGQLENELTENSWLVSDIEPEEIMRYDKNKLWKETLSVMGKNFEIWANSPANPSVN
jgi:putative transcriptional regulator